MTINCRKWKIYRKITKKINITHNLPISDMLFLNPTIYVFNFFT